MSRNKVIAGDYQHKKVVGTSGTIGIMVGFGKIINLNQTTLEKYEHMSEDHKKGTHVVSLEFKDGKKSLIEVEGKTYKTLLQVMFKTSTQQNPEQGDVIKTIPANNKGCRNGCFVFVVLAAVIIVGAIIAIINMSENPEKYDTSPKYEIGRSLDITVEQAENAIKVLSSVGISDEVTIKHDEGLDNAHFAGEKGYRLSNQEASNIILYMNSDGAIYNIRYADNDLYKKGEVISKLDKFIVTSIEEVQLQSETEEVLKSILKSPSTAKFPKTSEWKIWKQDGQTIIQSYVDSQNSFGAMVRSEFQLILVDSNITSLIIDGEEHIK